MWSALSKKHEHPEPNTQANRKHLPDATTETETMKTFLALASAALALSAFGTSEVQAGNSNSRVISTCDHCHKNVYAYYKPIRYVNRSAVYGWVPHYHDHNHVGFHNRAFRGCGPTPVQVYNYGYSSTWPMYYNRQLRDYNVYRSYPTGRGRFHGFWR